ncbi:hypothetical protein MTR67_047865 [Solanum verrucosum]|uniref:Gag-pol polyprotein n=1 Tax=Solanum verrucosum TaxID=315347 RepID=A0AAF0UYL0_SOLVR|nr:hypothetical protein MTR67_047865 [Solanum verrucosum]
MNSPEFTGSKLNKDQENFLDELQKVFDVMHVFDVERVKLASDNAPILKSSKRIRGRHQQKYPTKSQGRIP